MGEVSESKANENAEPVTKEEFKNDSVSEPKDDEIVKYGVKKLKEFIKINNSIHGLIACDKEKSIGIDKDELRFMALDSKKSAWTKERLINLRPQCRQYLVNKIKAFTKPKTTEDIEENTKKNNIFINESNGKQREEIIDEFVIILGKIKEEESKQQ